MSFNTKTLREISNKKYFMMKSYFGNLNLYHLIENSVILSEKYKHITLYRIKASITSRYLETHTSAYKR